MQYKKDQTLKKNDDNKVIKILEVIGDIVFVDYYNDGGSTVINWYAKEMEKSGWLPVGEPWEPKDKYFYIGDGEAVSQSYWNSDAMDIARKNFLGVYPDKESAEKALKDIKIKLGLR